MGTESVMKYKTGSLPRLRFHEFHDEYRKNEFGELAERSKLKYNPQLAEETFPCIELECLSQGTGDHFIYF